MVVAQSIRAPASKKPLTVDRMRFAYFFLIVCSLIFSSAAYGEVSGEIKLQSDDRFRGRSLSAGQPTLDADISIDTPIGIYAGASITAILKGKNRAGLQGYDGYVGYVAQVDENTAVDIGLAAYRFTSKYSGDQRDQYAEIYAGVSSGRFAAYVHYTPSYLGKSVPTIYTDFSYFRPIGSDFNITAHVGLLTQTSGPARLGRARTRYDTRVAISRPVLGLDAELAWTYGGANDRYFAGPWNGNSALVFSLSKHF